MIFLGFTASQRSQTRVGSSTDLPKQEQEPDQESKFSGVGLESKSDPITAGLDLRLRKRLFQLNVPGIKNKSNTK